MSNLTIPNDVSEPRYWCIGAYLQEESDFVSLSALSKLFSVRVKVICGDIEYLKKRGANIITRKTLRGKRWTTEVKLLSGLPQLKYKSVDVDALYDIWRELLTKKKPCLESLVIMTSM